MFLAVSKKLSAKAKSIAGHKLSRNVGWLTGAEFISRFGRIVAAIILARQLDAVAFGIAAVALTILRSLESLPRTESAPPSFEHALRTMIEPPTRRTA